MPASLLYGLAALFATTHFASANFDLWVVHGTQDTPSVGRYQVLGWLVDDHGQPTCDDINPGDANLETGYKERTDLSHGRLGIRCEPKSRCGVEHIDSDSWNDYDLIEMHFANKPLWHFTIYKDRGYLDGKTWMWPLFGTDGRTYGACFAYGGQSFGVCTAPGGLLRMWGQRKFRCLAELGAEQIKNAKRGVPPGRDFELLGMEVRNMTEVVPRSGWLEWKA
ncbi:hypothetical protein BU23DRAFT_552496 [Bimuria novae-zelandiae CBS 107.79]|uniref:Uncharacterized protein n=1 Tax=Bimuria novae-zelandiae CBS 107.79 TaxID=1447943 RepID=A0A6A5VFM7_9PLEO|nr:hypothetical protein BU23DRAFT_552496 [Bimuria novae-zelandiae CBS 107.79]